MNITDSDKKNWTPRMDKLQMYGMHPSEVWLCHVFATVSCDSCVCCTRVQKHINLLKHEKFVYHFWLTVYYLHEKNTAGCRSNPPDFAPSFCLRDQANEPINNYFKHSSTKNTRKTPPHSTTPSHSLLLMHRGCHANIFGWAKSGNMLPMTDVLQVIYGLEATLGLRTDRNHCVM